MTSELRQLRRVRWGVRLTLALGISASLAANILHAHHVLIDQVIAGWPPVAVFATIEAIARVPVRRRWLAAIRMTGLGFVAGIAFWVSYWHMASVAAAHGENGAKYLLPLSVDGLVVVASISLVELTGQISTAETAARHTVTAAPPETQPAPATAVLTPHGSPATGSVAHAPFVAEASGPRRRLATAEARPACGVDAVHGPHGVGRPSVNGTTNLSREPRDNADAGNDVPPDTPREAIIWWRAKEPALALSQIAAKVGRSERTVRRILDKAAPDAVRPQSSPADPSPPRVNGATVADLADQVVSD